MASFHAAGLVSGRAAGSEDGDSTLSAPRAVMICNTPLHVLNAVEASRHWRISPSEIWLVIKPVSSNSSHEAVSEMLSQAQWGRVIRIDDLPPAQRGFGFVLSLWRQYRHYRRWQRMLCSARDVRRVFVPLNRLVANRFIAAWLRPRQLVWFDDGTLSYVLAREQVLPAPKRQKAVRSKTNNSRKSASP
ncbi:MAG: hypothetical protein WED00_01040 [Aquisalimonadaceae bacterium]